jgi:hypothetical protein
MPFDQPVARVGSETVGMTHGRELETEKLFVLVPCLNEEASVHLAAREVLSVADDLEIAVEVMLIDDGSTDGTRQAMESMAGADSRCTVRVNERNLGVGRSVLDVIGDLPPNAWITIFPGDREFVFSSIRNFVAVRSQFELILGFLRNPVIRTFSRRLASHLFTRVVGIIYGFPWQYLNGMTMCRAHVFQDLQIVSTGHAFMAEAIAQAQLRTPELRIGEVPFSSRGRGTGSSKAFRPGSVMRAVWDVMRGTRAVAAFRRKITQESARR